MARLSEVIHAHGLPLRHDADDVTFAGSTLDVPLTNASHTGIISGGIVTINGGDSSLFDISAGTGYVVDNHTDGSAPTFTTVTWTTFTAVTITALATDTFTDIALNSSGAIQQQSIILGYTSNQARDLIFLSRIGHVDNATITSLRSSVVPAYNSFLNAFDLIHAIDPVNLTGNIYSGTSNSDLTVDKTAGTTYRVGTNYDASAKSPNITNDVQVLGITMIFTHQDGSGGFTAITGQTDIDPDQYDDGSGTLQSVPASDPFTVQRIFFFNASGTHIVQYGQNLYKTLAGAEAAIAGEVFVTDAALANDASLRSFLIVKRATTDLTNTNDAKFLQGGAFLGTAGTSVGGLTTLQQAYDNSPQPEMTVNASQGALCIHDASTPIGAPIFDVAINGGGTKFFSVDVSGITVPGTTTLNTVAYTWPASDGASGQQLTTNSSGTLSWAAAAAGGDPDQNLFESVLSDSGTAVADTTTDTLSILGGSGISTAVVADALTITNDSPNVIQDLWDVISSDSGSTTANTATDTITFAGGTSISTAVSGDILTITNDAPNVDQDLWDVISSDAGSTTANTTTDTLTIAGGASISTAVSGDILTVTNDSPNIVQDLWDVISSDAGSTTANTATDTITFTGGTGISTAVSGDTLTITNDSPNADQLLFLNVLSDSGTATADTTTDTLSILGASPLSTAVSADALTITFSFATANTWTNTNIHTRRIFVNGSANEDQIIIQGHTTQTMDLLLIETSAAAELLAVNNSGDLEVAGHVQVEEDQKIILDGTGDTYFIFDGTSVQLFVDSFLVREWSK